MILGQLLEQYPIFLNMVYLLYLQKFSFTFWKSSNLRWTPSTCSKSSPTSAESATVSYNAYNNNVLQTIMHQIHTDLSSAARYNQQVTQTVDHTVITCSKQPVAYKTLMKTLKTKQISMHFTDLYHLSFSDKG